MSPSRSATSADKYDVKRAHKSAYSGRIAVFDLIEVPRIHYLAVDGEGDPNTAADYRDALEALYSLSYAIKFGSKASGRDFVVGPLEGLWRSDDLGAFRRREKDSWQWTMLLALPDWITVDDVGAGRAAVLRKRNPRRLDRVRLLPLDEGLCVQTLHVGPYDAEAAVLARLHDEFLPEHHLTPTGDHHEIYLGDPKRTRPERLRTLLRQPVAPADQR